MNNNDHVSQPICDLQKLFSSQNCIGPWEE